MYSFDQPFELIPVGHSLANHNRASASFSAGRLC
jgi:hypothetical protein